MVNNKNLTEKKTLIKIFPIFVHLQIMFNRPVCRSTTILIT
jgi:hypothetical protein